MPTLRPLPNPRDSGNDQQRFMTFVLLSIAVFLVYQSMNLPRPPRPGAREAAEEPPGADADEALAADGPEDQLREGGEPLAVAEPDEPARRLVTLGSAELDGPYRMLVTLDNRGASIRRIELSTAQFRDVDDGGGYLGHLALAEAEGGAAMVRVVGPGTPAALAGLRVGDVIQDRAAFERNLAETKPGKPLPLRITRDGQAMDLLATLSRAPQAVIRPESENIRRHNPDLASPEYDEPSFLLTLAEAAGADASDPAVRAANKLLRQGNWEVASAAPTQVVFTKRLAGLGLELQKVFRLAETPESERDNDAFPSYHLGFEVRVTNLRPTPQRVAYDLHGPNGLPIEGWWYAARFGRKENGDGAWGTVGLRDVVARFAGSEFIQYRCSKIVEGGLDPLGEGASMAFVGLDAQYFSVMLLPEKESLEETVFATTRARLATGKLPEEGTLPTYNNPTFTATRDVVELAGGGGVQADAFRIFAGPKRPSLLEGYVVGGDPKYNLENLMYYGWFGAVARIMLGLLHFFGALVGNYGLAIIMLTVVVRGAMYPLSRKQAVSMAKMQALKPEMDRINERFKGEKDGQKKARAIQELYSKNGVNPLSGCLPMFVQVPIFIGLYRALAVDIELRQAPLFSESIRFCNNLAAPDQLLDWSHLWWRSFNNGIGVFPPGLGPYFNALPMVTVGLFLLQQKLFMPPPANEQAALQQKMMMYVMPVFGLMFFKVPSGLCLYFIASSLWGIAERTLIPKPEPPKDVAPASIAPPKKPTGGQASIGAAAKRAANAKKKKKRK